MKGIKKKCLIIAKTASTVLVACGRIKKESLQNADFSNI